MKKVFVIALVGLMLFSCKSKKAVSNGVEVSNKGVSVKELNISNIVDISSQIGIKGNWEITAVTYPGSEFIKITSFDIADSQCFVGSLWRFFSNNNQANISMKTANCAEFNSPVNWYVNNERQFIMKILWAGEKAKKVRNGYLLTLANRTETSFQLIDKLKVGNKETDVVYQFQKTDKIFK